MNTYQTFTLTLVVTQQCNLNCTYCYAGEHTACAMTFDTAAAAIDNAFASIEAGGSLEIGFFGGEPLLEAALILELMAYARTAGRKLNVAVAFSLTTNGTIDTAAAWELMLQPDLFLAVSCDGLPAVHDTHRSVSSANVLKTIARLVDRARQFYVISVVQPDTVGDLVAGIAFLYELGVRRFQPSLDIWSDWDEAVCEQLEQAVADCAEFWGEHIPEIHIAWMDDKAARLLGTAPEDLCRFGNGEITVTPAGDLYPCERLINEQAFRMAWTLDDVDDFLDHYEPQFAHDGLCGQCALEGTCSTYCKCTNYIRTGNPYNADGFLCRFNKACLENTVNILKSVSVFHSDPKQVLDRVDVRDQNSEFSGRIDVMNEVARS